MGSKLYGHTLVKGTWHKINIHLKRDRRGKQHKIHSSLPTHAGDVTHRKSKGNVPPTQLNSFRECAQITNKKKGRNTYRLLWNWSYDLPDLDNSKLWNATFADKTCSGWILACHLQQPIIPRTIRLIQMYTLWSVMREIPLRRAQKEHKINKRLCSPRCKCQTIVTNTLINDWLLSYNKCIINIIYSRIVIHEKF